MGSIYVITSVLENKNMNFCQIDYKVASRRIIYLHVSFRISLERAPGSVALLSLCINTASRKPNLTNVAT